MSRKIRYYTEGKADNALLSILEVEQRMISDNGGNSGVARAMKNQQRNYHNVVIGIIDDDKGRNYHSYFSEFELIAKPDDFKLKHKPGSNQFIIILCCPAIEMWLLNSAKSVSIIPEDYEMSSNVKIFGKTIKSINIAKNENFMKFIRTIKHEKAESFTLLSNVLKNPFIYLQ